MIVSEDEKDASQGVYLVDNFLKNYCIDTKRAKVDTPSGVQDEEEVPGNLVNGLAIDTGVNDEIKETVNTVVDDGSDINSNIATDATTDDDTTSIKNENSSEITNTDGAAEQKYADTEATVTVETASTQTMEQSTTDINGASIPTQINQSTVLYTTAPSTSLNTPTTLQGSLDSGAEVVGLDGGAGVKDTTQSSSTTNAAGYKKKGYTNVETMNIPADRVG
uniref:Uncharacterized protein n=1 Tax=Lygus hesperus TaxID=30085 RepID=A0A0A9XN67_LYGHE